MTDAPKLKPCPFCGNADELLYGFGGRIFCDECGCEGPFSHFFKGDWNTRADLIDMGVMARVEAALMRQHAWHLSQTEPVDMGGVEVVPFEAYAEGSMCEETLDALTGLRAMMEKLK